MYPITWTTAFSTSNSTTISAPEESVGYRFQCTSASLHNWVQVPQQFVQWPSPTPEAPYIPEAIEGETDDMLMVNKFLIGCDPEFVALHGNGRLVDLTVALQEKGEIGYDHGGLVGEVRPAPAKGAYGLLKKIQRLVKAADKLLGAKLRAGALAQREPQERIYTLGGHVHFDLPAFDYDAEVGRKNTDAHRLRVAALDEVTRTLEALDILPQKDSDYRRKASQYGRFGDIRTDTSKYNKKHITEYRTMASWLFDPKVAMVCLTGAKLAAAKPKEVLTILKTREFKDLQNLFETFKGADINAARVHERLMERGLKHLQADPTADFRQKWEVLGV